MEEWMFFVRFGGDIRFFIYIFIVYGYICNWVFIMFIIFIFIMILRDDRYFIFINVNYKLIFFFYS